MKKTAKTPVPFTMKTVRNHVLTMVPENNGIIATISEDPDDTRDNKGYYYLSAFGKDHNTAAANLCAICQKAVNGETIPFDQCCCKNIVPESDIIWPVFPSPDHPASCHYVIETGVMPGDLDKPTSYAGIRVMQCALCGEVWTVVYADSNWLRHKPRIITHWGNNPNLINLRMIKPPKIEIEKHPIKIFQIGNESFLSFSELNVRLASHD